MGSIKSTALKRRLSAEIKSNRPVPSWVVARTRGRVRVNPYRRHWRRNKLKLRGKR